MTEITLRKIDATNYTDAMKLKVHDSQKDFIASNEKSLIQSAYGSPDISTPYGIYDDETMVGFLLVLFNEDTPDTYWVWRLMVDANHQKKGYGKAAMQKLIADTKAEGKYKFLRLYFVPTNENAQKFYAGLGFIEEGLNEEWGEILAAYDLTK